MKPSRMNMLRRPPRYLTAAVSKKIAGVQIYGDGLIRAAFTGYTK